MKCKRCGNTDKSYFYQGSKGIYCRKCIRFNRILLEEELGSFDYDIALGVQEYAFSYNLTSRQKQASQMCADYAEKHGLPFVLSVSLGACSFDYLNRDLNELLTLADKSLYEQKKIHHARIKI